MREFIYSQNIGNTTIAPNNSGFIKTCKRINGEIFFVDNYGVAYKVDGNSCQCIEILTPTELFWTCLYIEDYMAYCAMSENDLMCDRVAEIIENLETNPRFKKIGFEKLIKWRRDNLDWLNKLQSESKENPSPSEVWAALEGKE